MKNSLFILWIFAGVLLFTFAMKRFVESYRFKAHAVVLAGEVIATPKLGSSQRTGMPIVQYVAPSGEKREHKYNAPLAGSEFEVGEKVKVLYDPRSGTTRLDDWGELYLVSSLIGFIAFLVLLPPLVGGAIYMYVRWPYGNLGLATRRKT